MAIDALLAGPLRVVNIGLEGFARDLAVNGAAVAHVDWSPPRFAFDEVIERANAQALGRMLAAQPVLADVRRAGDLVAELDARRLLLHAKEIHKLTIAVERQGMTMVPLELYFNARGIAKLKIALAQGKKLHDKRETEKKRSWQREKGRLLREKG